MTKSKLIQLVKKQLQGVGHGISFDVITGGVRLEHSWWHVPVVATRNGNDVPREVTINIFANVEDELERKQGVSVLFIPAAPEPTPTGAGKR